MVAAIDSFQPLRDDVKAIYLGRDESTQTFGKIYQFESDKVSIIFKRIFGKYARACGPPTYGTAEVTMETESPELKTKIQEIIEEPKTRTPLGDASIVREIVWKIAPIV